jgi:hypothetical protein
LNDFPKKTFDIQLNKSKIGIKDIINQYLRVSFMNNIAFLLVAVLITTSFIGCSKKHEEESASTDGLNGVATENIVSVDGMPAEGEAIPVIVDNAPINTEGSVPAVAVGDKPTAEQIQQALKNAGLYNGKVDGNIGPRTKKAIEAFQSQNGLKADGKVGPRTWKALSAHLNQTQEVANPSADSQVVGQ